MLASALATGNEVSPSEKVELAAAYIGVVVLGVSMVLGVVDMVVLCCTYIPPIRKLLSLQHRDLQYAIDQSKRNEIEDPADGGGGAVMLQVPMINPAAAPIQQQQQPMQHPAPQHTTPNPNPPLREHDNIQQQPQQQEQEEELQPRQASEIDDEDAAIKQIITNLEAYERKEEARKALEEEEEINQNQNQLDLCSTASLVFHEEEKA